MKHGGGGGEVVEVLAVVVNGGLSMWPTGLMLNVTSSWSSNSRAFD